MLVTVTWASATMILYGKKYLIHGMRAVHANRLVSIMITFACSLIKTASIKEIITFVFVNWHDAWKQGKDLCTYLIFAHKGMFTAQENLASVYLFLQQHSPCPQYTLVDHTVQDQCDVGLGVGTDGVFLHWVSKLQCHQSCGPPSTCERTAVPPATDTTRSFSKVTVLALNTGCDAVTGWEIFDISKDRKGKGKVHPRTGQKAHRSSRL